jgi:sugar phosphate isomerase/epimerase
MTQVTRRDLFRAATVALALPVARTGATSRDLAGPESRTAKPESRESMFVSLNPSLTRAMPWQEFAQLAARLGYGGVDVMLDSTMKDGAAATRKLLSSLNLRPGAINLPVRFGGEEAQYADDLKRLDAAATFAAEVDCPRMVAVLPPASATPKPEYRKVIRDRVATIARALARSDVRLGLEFLGPMYFHTRQPHEFIWRMDEALAFAKDCGPNVGLLLDAWHWHHAGATAADILAAGRERIVHIHVSDARKQAPEEVRDNQRLMPGEGVIDLTAFFGALKQIGYADAVSPEPIGRVPPEMSPEDGARLGLETTRGVMKRAGIGV